MELATDILSGVWFALQTVWNIVMIPTDWGFPIGTLFQLVYLVIAWWAYTKYVPERVQTYVSNKVTPYIGSGIRRARDFIGHNMIAYSPSRSGDRAQSISVRTWTFKGVMIVWSTGIISTLLWQYAAWPYLRQSLPF